MKLLTPALRKTLPQLYSQENESDPLVVAKFFNPCGAGTWYATEASAVLEGGEYVALTAVPKGVTPQDVIFFGLCVIQEAELGNFSLNELESYRSPFGTGIERDIHWEPVPLSKVRAGVQ